MPPRDDDWQTLDEAVPAAEATRVEQPQGDLSTGSERSASERRKTERWIGRYRLLEVLGEGGMGTVFLAEQREPIRRQVALKVVQADLRIPHLRQRFELERQALARMSHPNIAQVYEAADTQEGQPFVVMEHVAGEPITLYCDRHRLGVEARLELFEAVCQGVHHAHQKGVLHRDIKPSNVLVTEVEGRPLPKLIDFGIAKDLDAGAEAGQPQLTGLAVVGTPNYLSPESVLTPGGADVDIRTDVYALGVLLFELLVGEVPFAHRGGQDLLGLLQQIREQEAPAPSRRFAALDPVLAGARARARGESVAGVPRRLRGDLDWIALKALAKERERRYGSASELAADVARYRRHQPVLAGPPSRRYAAAKFVRRNRLAVAAGAAVAVALAGGFVARTLEAERANREAGRANLEAVRANREAAAAREVSGFLVELFSVSDPDQARGRTVTARELLERGAERIRSELPDQPLTRAALMETMGRVHRSLGLYEEARPLLEEALALREEALGAEHLEVAETLLALGLLASDQGRYEEAEGHLRRALELRTAALGADHPQSAAALSELADQYAIQARYREAEPLMRRALAIREAALGQGHPQVADTVDRLAVLLTDSGRTEEALPLLERALAIRQGALGEDHPKVAYSMNGVAIAHARLGELERARELFARVVAIRERVLGPRHADYAQSLNNLAIVELDLGDAEEGRRLLRRAGEVYEAALGPDHPRVANAWHNLGTTYRDAGAWRQAEIWFRRALEIRERALGAEAPLLAPTLHELGRALAGQESHAEAEPFYQRALALRERELGPEHAMVLATLEDYAELLRASGRGVEAAALEARVRAARPRAID